MARRLQVRSTDISKDKGTAARCLIWVYYNFPLCGKGAHPLRSAEIFSPALNLFKQTIVKVQKFPLEIAQCQLGDFALTVHYCPF